MKRTGFTLIELIIVLGIITILAAVVAPVSWSSYLSYELFAERDTLLSLLQNARTYALVNQNESSHGLFINQQTLILFQGAHFENRDPIYDQAIPRRAVVNISGPSELVFASLSAETTPASYILTAGGKNITVSVNSEGTIDL